MPKIDMERLAEKYELKMQVEEHFDVTNHQEARDVPTLKAPHKPTKDQWEKHQATHTSFEPWCKHCLVARADRHKHPSKGRKPLVVPDIDKGINKPIKISLDYMYLHARVGKNRNVEHNPPQFVMVDHNSGRVWAYRVPNKGVMDDASWLPKRLVQDINKCGYEGTRIQFKTDQEPSIVALQNTIQQVRKNVIPLNSPVGESESNGRVENAIRRVQDKFRVLRHQVEHGIQQKIPEDAPIMSWMIRWAAELITKYPIGDDGRIAYERLRHEQCKLPMVPFGEAVMYLAMKTASRSKGELARRIGLWLGTIERTEETIIGTQAGVVKCRTVNRLSDKDQWNAELVTNMQGVPWITEDWYRNTSKHKMKMWQC